MIADSSWKVTKGGRINRLIDSDPCVGEHVVIVLVPLAGWPGNRRAFENELDHTLNCVQGWSALSSDDGFPARSSKRPERIPRGGDGGGFTICSRLHRRKMAS